MTYPVKAQRRSITVEISLKMHDGLRKAGESRHMSTTAYAQMLLEAAYTASLQETGDRSLDATVGAALILYGNGMDTEAIARALKCKEHTVESIIRAFQGEMRSAA